jgi:hypothetical protein
MSAEMRRNGKFITRALRILLLATVTACGGGGGGGGGEAPAPGGGSGIGGDTSGCGDGAPTGSGPLLSAQQAYVKGSNAQALDGFGGALALSANGNVLVAGARGDWNGSNGFAAIHGGSPSTGAAYVFSRSGTTWAQRAHLQPSSLSVGDGFGVAVAVSGDGNTIAIGAYGDASVAAASGAVYVFVCSAGVWSQQAHIKASNAGANDRFGANVSLSADGSTLAVGAPNEDSSATGIDGNQVLNNATDSGAVYVFTRSAGAWTQQAYVKASNTGGGDFFGSAVRLSSNGDTLAVGAFNESSAATGVDGNQADNSAPDAGAVYVFTRNGASWSQQAYVKASNTDAADDFGLHLALSGDGNTLAVGARGEASASTGIGGIETDNSAPFAGAVYVFTRGGASWTQQAYVKASNAERDDRFGRAVALSADGNVLLVGAVDESGGAIGIGGNEASNGAILSGAAYEFTRSGTVWTQVRYIKASNTGPRDFFGWSLALSGDASTLAVGAPDEDSAATGIDGNQANNSALSAGAVYVFQ